MERLKDHEDFSFSYPFIIFYKEDLEYLTKLFSENFSEIKIEIDDFKLDNINEVNEIPKDFVNSFRIIGYDNDGSFRERKISFIIKKKSANLYINSNEIKCRGIKSEIETIIKMRTNSLNILDSKWLLLISPILFLLLWQSLSTYKKIINPIDFTLLFIFILFSCFIMSFVIIFLPNLLSNKIILKYSWQKTSFFKKNVDNIIVGIISAIFGTVIGGLLVYLITKNYCSLNNP